MTGSNVIIIEISGYELEFTGADDGVTLSGAKGNGSRLAVLDKVGDMPVTCIGKKAFLADKSLKEISLPETVSLVDDWAFAGCENLRTFIKRGSANISFGSRVFDKCTRVENICLGYEEPDDLSHLMGTVIHRMPAEYLLKDTDIGSRGWYEKWDMCLGTFINEPDEDGYTDLVLCGEEDIFYNEPDFAENKRKKKASLCLTRLMHPENLGPDFKSKYVSYLMEHTKGSKTEEGWLVLLDEYGEQTDYFKLFYDTGCINRDNIDSMLADMGGIHAEAKAYMLSLKREKFSEEDIFGQFKL